MLGTFQQSQLRIEVNAPEAVIREAILCPQQVINWMWPQQFSAGLPNRMISGLTFTSWAGPVAIQHDVRSATDHELKMLLSKGIDGLHEWCWGDGWVQSSIEGVSLLPINLGQTFSLFRLRQFIESHHQQSQST